MREFSIIAAFVNKADGAFVRRDAGGEPQPLGVNVLVKPPGSFLTPDEAQITRLTAARCLGAELRGSASAPALNTVNPPAPGASEPVSHAQATGVFAASETTEPPIGADQGGGGAADAPRAEGGGGEPAVVEPAVEPVVEPVAEPVVEPAAAAAPSEAEAGAAHVEGANGGGGGERPKSGQGGRKPPKPRAPRKS